jgi:hypothetical protein
VKWIEISQNGLNSSAIVVNVVQQQGISPCVGSNELTTIEKKIITFVILEGK